MAAETAQSTPSQSSLNQRPQGCTCPPYPTIDLTDQYRRLFLSTLSSKSPSDSDIKQSNSVLLSSSSVSRRQLLDAFRHYGLFHVVVRNPPSGSHLTSLVGDVEARTKRLFEPQFLSRDGRIPASSTGGALPDGGLHTVCFSSPEKSYSGGDSRILEATYRGRTAESGGTNGESEPKQSWEFRRCRGLVSIAEKGDEIGAQSEGGLLDETLPKWTDALHSVATTVVDTLGIPPSAVLNGRDCSCRSRPHAGNARAGGCHCCAIDLLRVFRYDSLTNARDQSDRPGSSEHTDWGSLTVVWQDCSGGLQAWCAECQRWNDVPVPPGGCTASTEEGGKIRGEEEVRLFVHVGDFLSLSSGSAWPSPKHRVLCPLRDRSVDTNSSNDIMLAGRSSLVYFAYPPPGASISDTGPILAKVEEGASRMDESAALAMLPYQHYMLLKDQSSKADGEECLNGKETQAKLVFDRIHSVPFDDVIRRKWNQVQRG
uniref:Isopenicillin N synthase-like Fe(2+) 2OG dioxygenase domain-containing protein n=1 Tax=Odontella aurita TaxID=265563 RepID=A0A7S4N344_9STRA